MAPIFRLEVGAGRLATLTFDSPGRRVNIFTREALAELEALLPRLAGMDGDIGLLVLTSGKEGNFIAGADVEEIAGVADPALAEAGARLGHRLFGAWEALPFPTVAAIRGSCVGGGTELSLASTFRVASDGAGTRIGLPEVRLGIVPGWGGCTRLPRLVGIAGALDLILTGRTVDGRKALKLGLVDALLPDARFLDRVGDFARERMSRPQRSRKPGGAARAGVRSWLLEKNPLGRHVLFDQARKKTLAESRGNYPAPLRAIEVVRIGIEDGPVAGFDAEARALAELATGEISKNLVHLFGLTEAAKRRQGLPGGEARPVRSTAVLGAGTMGGGIAQLIAQETGLAVRLKDVAPPALALGMDHAARLFGKLLARHRLDEATARRKLAQIHPALDYGGFARVDLVIEAIVEKLPVKQEVLAEVARQVQAGAVLASNTSSLPIAEIRARTQHPERVVGLHFFNPVDKMPLVEVIVPEGADPVAVNTVFAFARKLGKTPVLVKDSPGFLVNRLLMFYSLEALWLLDAGFPVEEIDRAMLDWGMPMGPLALTDEVGIDVALKVAHFLSATWPDRLPLPGWLDRLPENGRLGAKNQRGIYRYQDGERREPDPEAYALLGLARRPRSADLAALAHRMVLPMVNEAARCLEEGTVGGAGELDLAMIFGTGFPPFRGGLCRWADRQGSAALIADLEKLAREGGPRLQPSEALRRTAAAGGFYARFAGG
jgi:3-hydroxyacyl-CoA dehydrogenase/enoyl-CoA hydratase/3-hydroxybutyryl-CoA epimerase